MTEAVPNSAWGFAGIVIGGALTLAGRLWAQRWRRQERTETRLLGEATQSTKAMEVVFAEGRALYESIRVERDALQHENALLLERIRALEARK